MLIAAAVLLLLCRAGKQRKSTRSAATAIVSLALQQLLFSAVDIAATAAGAVVSAACGQHWLWHIRRLLRHCHRARRHQSRSWGPWRFRSRHAGRIARCAYPLSRSAAALVLYRLIYYILPLLMALALLVTLEVRRGSATAVTQAAVSLAPLLLAAYTLIIGVMLLISGVTPATDEATELLALHVPLPLVEASHFLGSICGARPLLVARGMLLRLDAAWWGGLLLGIVSMLLALPKGIAISEAALILFLVVALALSHPQFTRRASLMAQPFTGGWLLSVVAIVAALTGLLFFAYRDVDYAQEMWWQFGSRTLHAPPFIACAGGSGNARTRTGSQTTVAPARRGAADQMQRNSKRLPALSMPSPMRTPALH